MPYKTQSDKFCSKKQINSGNDWNDFYNGINLRLRVNSAIYIVR